MKESNDRNHEKNELFTKENYFEKDKEDFDIVMFIVIGILAVFLSLALATAWVLLTIDLYFL